MAIELEMHYGSGKSQRLSQEIDPGKAGTMFGTDAKGEPSFFLNIHNDAITNEVVISRVPKEDFVFDGDNVRRQVPETIKPERKIEQGGSYFIEFPFVEQMGQRVLEIRNVKRPR